MLLDIVTPGEYGFLEMCKAIVREIVPAAAEQHHNYSKLGLGSSSKVQPVRD